MKLLRLVTVTSFACLSCLSLGPSASAQPKANRTSKPLTDCSSAVSMIVAPDGTCYNLSYLTTLGNARSQLSAAKDLQNQVAALNASTGKATTFTYDVGDGKSISHTYSDNPSEDEKKARLQLLGLASNNVREKATQANGVEDAAFVLQTYVMSQLNGSLAGRSLNTPLVGKAH